MNLQQLNNTIHQASKSELIANLETFKTDIANALNAGESEAYYKNHTGRELYRKLHNFGLGSVISSIGDAHDNGFRPLTVSGIKVKWTPASLTTENWYDAADTATITDTVGVVSQWDDKSGNANHLSVVGSNIFTDRRTRNSNNVMDIEEGSYFRKTAYQLPADCSIFMMSAIDSISVNTDAVFAIRGGSSQNFQFDSGDVVGVQDQFLARFNATNIGTSNTFASTDQKGPSIYELIFDLNGDGDLEVFIDGSSFGTTAYTAQCGANSELLLFSNRSLGQFPDGCIAEFIVVPSVLPATDRQKMEGYLAHKWGTESQLGGSHPYKYSSPH